MPELPEVETTLRAIKKFKGQLLEEVKIHNRNLRWKIDHNLEKDSKNKKIISISRRAKYIIFDLEHMHLFLHLGMSGSLRIQKKDDNFFMKHDHVEFIFQNEKIIFNDPRRFGSLHITKNVGNHKLISQLGPEPLSNDFNGEYLLALSKKSKTNIKTLIMNQKNVVGIGNIYASEALFLSKINPLKTANRLNLKECKKIVSSSKEVLNQAIKVGGTTIKDFYSADGNRGYFSIQLNVYGRDGKKCKKCKGKIKKTIINQRATFYCLNCQS